MIWQLCLDPTPLCSSNPWEIMERTLLPRNSEPENGTFLFLFDFFVSPQRCGKEEGVFTAQYFYFPPRAGNETVSSRKKARRDETVSISSRISRWSRKKILVSLKKVSYIKLYAIKNPCNFPYLTFLTEIFFCKVHKFQPFFFLLKVSGKIFGLVSRPRLV